MSRIIVFVTCLVFINAAFANGNWSSVHNSGFGFSIDGVQQSMQDRQQLAYENMMSQLRKLHGDIFNLPYDSEYIRTTIIPEVNAQRLTIAPHYPDRQQYGENGDLAYQLMRVWFETYPAEYNAYIEFLNNYIASHSN